LTRNGKVLNFFFNITVLSNLLEELDGLGLVLPETGEGNSFLLGGLALAALRTASHDGTLGEADLSGKSTDDGAVLNAILLLFRGLFLAGLLRDTTLVLLLSVLLFFRRILAKTPLLFRGITTVLLHVRLALLLLFFRGITLLAPPRRFLFLRGFFRRISLLTTLLHPLFFFFGGRDLVLGTHMLTTNLLALLLRFFRRVPLLALVPALRLLLLGLTSLNARALMVFTEKLVNFILLKLLFQIPDLLFAGRFNGMLAFCTDTVASNEFVAFGVFFTMRSDEFMGGFIVVVAADTAGISLVVRVNVHKGGVSVVVKVEVLVFGTDVDDGVIVNVLGFNNIDKDLVVLAVVEGERSVSSDTVHGTVDNNLSLDFIRSVFRGSQFNNGVEELNFKLLRLNGLVEDFEDNSVVGSSAAVTGQDVFAMALDIKGESDVIESVDSLLSKTTRIILVPLEDDFFHVLLVGELHVRRSETRKTNVVHADVFIGQVEFNIVKKRPWRNAGSVGLDDNFVIIIVFSLANFGPDVRPELVLDESQELGRILLKPGRDLVGVGDCQLHLVKAVVLDVSPTASITNGMTVLLFSETTNFVPLGLKKTPAVLDAFTLFFGLGGVELEDECVTFVGVPVKDVGNKGGVHVISVEV